jgi:hypothetical protein
LHIWSVMTNDVRVVSSPDGGWMVALDEQALAGFYGPDARQLAESHREVLVALLTASPDLPMMDEPSSQVWVH